MQMNFSEDLNLDSYPHTPQALIVVKWTSHQMCTMALQMKIQHIELLQSSKCSYICNWFFINFVGFINFEI